MSYGRQGEKKYEPPVPKAGQAGKPAFSSGHKDFEKELTKKAAEDMVKDSGKSKDS
jgi:hypothetical protein